MIQRYCDFLGCGELLTTDCLRAKVRRGPGKLGGRELDLCGTHAVQVEALILGRPDADKGNTAPAKPRKVKPSKPPEAAA